MKQIQDLTEMDPENVAILQARVQKFNARAGARVGDFLKLTPPDPRCPNYTRFTHDWGDLMQTGGQSGGSYYLIGGGGLSYSGSLDHGISPDDLLLTEETKHGAVWFFDKDFSGAGRGIECWVPMRVFIPRPGAKLDGIGELRCPYYLGVNSEKDARGFYYRYSVSKHSYGQNAFQTEAELRAWLVSERLALSRPLDDQHSQSLAWPGPHWCPRCATNNAFVNQCSCDPNNLPTKPHALPPH